MQKNPTRYKPYFLVRTLEFKTNILDVCRKREDKWAEEVQLRVLGACSDLHAVEARYHWKFYKLFTSDCNISCAKNKVSGDDLSKEVCAFSEVTEGMLENNTKMLNSV